jgi:hypothetical protein
MTDSEKLLKMKQFKSFCPTHACTIPITGTLATQRKEELQMEIERQQELGTEGLLDDDCYLAECNLGNLEETSGIRKTYWLLAIQAAREASRLEGIRTQPVATVQNNI